MTNNKMFLQILRDENLLEEEDLNLVGQTLSDYGLTVCEAPASDLKDKLQKGSRDHCSLGSN
jgi:hypothetical protein